MVLFLDSSALVKNYVAEHGSEWMRSMIDPVGGNELYVALVSGAEVISAIVRRRRVGNLELSAADAAIREFLDDWQHAYAHVAVDEHLMDSAIELARRYEPRGYDAIQLAAAVLLHRRYGDAGTTIAIVSADDELNVAAVAEGLRVENPNQH